MAAKKKPAKKKAPKKVKKAAAKKAVKAKGRVHKGMKAIRYNAAKKKQILAYVKEVNKKKGKGGIAAAIRRYKVSAITINRWLDK